MPSSAFADDDDNLVNPQQRPDSSFIYDTSIAALGNADAYYDNQTVQVVGEAIGDSIREGLDNRHRWITLAANEKDSTATVSVLMTAEQAAKIDTYGKYGTTGTKLQVRGTFHLVCTEHEGLTDLHADIVTVVEKGKHHEDEFDVNAFVPGAIATALGLALMGVFYYLRERQR
ncbi:hydrolase [Gordonibacter pamelaeae]|uniref:hydrolase n=1 Tax=Gordonibacter TaxID=644652 RepID=UPI00242FABF2|nr:hydrolase [Gordonibacter pamelaeae]